MSFHFRFQKILNHRKSIEDLKKTEFAEKKKEADQAFIKLKELNQSVTEARELMALSVKTGGPTEVLKQLEEFIVGQKIRIENQRTLLRQKLDLQEKAQEILTEAAREHKIMKRLKEKKEEVYKKEMNKLDQKKTDEMVVMRFNR